MSKYLLPFIFGCSAIDLPDETQELCGDKIDLVEAACERASVVGANDNKELYDAIKEFKMCAGKQYKVICSDDGWTNILTISEEGGRR